jgi:hypothetical protein
MDTVLINTAAANSTVVMDLCNGAAIASVTLTLAPHEKRTLAIADLFKDVATDVINESGVLITSSQPLAGYYAFETGNDNLYYALLDYEKADTEMTIPHVACNSYWWTAVNLFNPHEGENAELQLIPYDSNGDKMDDEVKTVSLAPLTKYVTSIYGLWGSTGDTIAFLKIEVADGPPVVGLYGYGNMQNSMVAGIPLESRD